MAALPGKENAAKMKPTLMQSHTSPNEKQQAINLRAFRWAYEQEGLSVTAKAVLASFAVHANERGYTWPGVDHIATTWGLDERTVRRQIKALLVRHKLRATRKRVGMTGQGKVYRLPKSAYERRAQSHPLEKTKGGRKAGERRAQCPQNNGIMNNTSNELITVGNSTPPASSNGKSGVVFEGHQHQDQPARDHVKWPEFAEWCHSKLDKRGKPRHTY
jgi:hypothetical protein